MYLTVMGPRGARYALWRNAVTLHLLCVVNDRRGKIKAANSHQMR